MDTVPEAVIEASTAARIDAEHVNVDFPLYHGNARSLKRMVFRTVAGRVATEDRKSVV